jgi:hypothetical protein
MRLGSLIWRWHRRLGSLMWRWHRAELKLAWGVQNSSEIYSRLVDHRGQFGSCWVSDAEKHLRGPEEKIGREQRGFDFKGVQNYREAVSFCATSKPVRVGFGAWRWDLPERSWGGNRSRNPGSWISWGRRPMKGACCSSPCCLLGDIFPLYKRWEAVGPGVWSGTTRNSVGKPGSSTSLPIADIKQFPEFTFEEVTAS